jgi:hypothetical protein
MTEIPEPSNYHLKDNPIRAVKEYIYLPHPLHPFFLKEKGMGVELSVLISRLRITKYCT